MTSPKRKRPYTKTGPGANWVPDPCPACGKARYTERNNEKQRPCASCARKSEHARRRAEAKSANA